MPEDKRRSRGRPPHLPTAAQRFQVEVLKGTGWPDAAIATFQGISLHTLKKSYKSELQGGKDRFGCLLSVSLGQQALKGKLPAIFFLLKTQYGWRENVGLQPLGRNGEPIDLNKLDDRSLGQVLEAVRAAIGGGAFGGDTEDAADGWDNLGMGSQSRPTN